MGRRPIRSTFRSHGLRRLLEVILKYNARRERRMGCEARTRKWLLIQPPRMTADERLNHEYLYIRI